MLGNGVLYVGGIGPEMETKKEMENLQPDGVAEGFDNDSFRVEFRKPYKFEGKEYKDIDLSGLEDLTGMQYVQITQRLNRTNPETAVGVVELSPAFAVKIATAVSKLPEEFFYMLPANELLKIKNRISGYFFGD